MSEEMKEPMQTDNDCKGKEITLENLSPVFTPEQEAANRRELEQQLYDVFRKYADKRRAKEAGA